MYVRIYNTEKGVRMDRIYFQERFAVLKQKLQAERALEKKAGDEKREQDRWIHYGNCRYLEGQIDTIHQMINGAFGFKV